MAFRETIGPRGRLPSEDTARIGVFSKGIDRHSARTQMEIEGDRDLEENVLRLTAIVG